MESKSGKICRTMRFRWVRKRVKIVSRDESWPEKERQAKGQKMHSKTHRASQVGLRSDD